MKVKSYFVLLKLEPFIGKMRQMWQSTNAFAVVQMTCDDMLFKLLHYWLIIKQKSCKMMLKRIEHCCYDIRSAVLICSNFEVPWYCLTQACLPCEIL